MEEVSGDIREARLILRDLEWPKRCVKRCGISHWAVGLLKSSLQSLDWNGIVECVLQGERSLLMQFSMKVTAVS